MTNQASSSGLQLRSLVKADSTLELSLADIATPEPCADEVVVRVDAAPINPSDLGLLLSAADMSTAKASGTATHPIVTATIPERALNSVRARFDQSMPVGNEGAGLVVRTGSSAAAKALLGKTVAVLGGAMYSQFRTVNVSQCLVLPSGTSAKEGASSFVNPLTALGMVETMKSEGHTALVHTAAASNLGLMLQRLCTKDKIGLVNIVRKQEQVAALKELGAEYVCNSSSASFMDDLVAALTKTGATLAFDAIGGGKLGSQILTAMEIVASAKAKAFSRYGSTVHKQLYIYGGLDTGPTELARSYGMAWGVGGWLVTPFLQRIGIEGAEKLKTRVANEIKTTFASKYSGECSLVEALSLDVIAAYAKRATGEKYLILPHKS